MKRKLYDTLLEWKRQRHGATALMVEGCRRVGKSYLVEHFARQEYRSYILIDFSRTTDAVRDIFRNDILDLDLFFSKLSVIYGIKLYERESVVIFDEVQLFPSARQLVKHLVAYGKYDIIETGSLITLKKNIESIVIPSEEERIHMFPMDFEEFLWSTGDEATVPFLRDCYEKRRPLGQALHRKVLSDYRQYLLVGGMPQAVSAYLERKSFEDADAVKRGILKLYRDDVAKFAKGYESRVYSVFDGIPSQLSKHEKKYTLASLGKDARFRDYEDSFIWLDEARVVNLCFASTDPNVGLGLNEERTTLKCYMNDTGLLLSHAFSETALMEENIYRELLFGKLSLNEGMILENAVAQELVCSGHKLFFYSESDRSDSENRMEIDFLIRSGKRIQPIEVKSSSYRTHSSLDKFRRKFGKRIGKPCILYTKDLTEDESVLYLPVYMAFCL